MLPGCSPRCTTVDPLPESEIPIQPTVESTNLDPKLFVSGYTIGDTIPANHFWIYAHDGPTHLARLSLDRSVHLTLIQNNVILSLAQHRLADATIPKLVGEISFELDSQPTYQPLPTSAPHWAFETYRWEMGATEVRLIRAQYLGADRYKRSWMNNGWSLYYSNKELQQSLLERRWLHLP